jgi:hypothetical protein
MRLDEKPSVPTSYGCFKNRAKTIIGLYLFNEKYKLVSKTTCITMSGHLSTEEKALFKAEIDAIRRKDYAFHRVLEANKIKFKGNHCARRYGGIRRSSSFWQSQDVSIQS